MHYFAVSILSGLIELWLLLCCKLFGDIEALMLLLILDVVIVDELVGEEVTTKVFIDIFGVSEPVVEI